MVALVALLDERDNDENGEQEEDADADEIHGAY